MAHLCVIVHNVEDEDSVVCTLHIVLHVHLHLCTDLSRNTVISDIDSLVVQ